MKTISFTEEEVLALAEIIPFARPETRDEARIQRNIYKKVLNASVDAEEEEDYSDYANYKPTSEKSEEQHCCNCNHCSSEKFSDEELAKILADILKRSN